MRAKLCYNLKQLWLATIKPHSLKSFFTANISNFSFQGFCMMPDTCICRDGWTGPNCTECVPYWNCQHGSCKKPWECNCDPGYFGLECNDTKTVGIGSSYLFYESSTLFLQIIVNTSKVQGCLLTKIRRFKDGSCAKIILWHQERKLWHFVTHLN